MNFKTVPTYAIFINKMWPYIDPEGRKGQKNKYQVLKMVSLLQNKLNFKNLKKKMVLIIFSRIKYILLILLI